MNADDIIRRLSSQVQSITSALAQLARRVRRLEHLEYVGPGTGGGKHVIQNEGVNLPERPILDFTDGGVTASDVGDKTKVSIPAIRIQNEGVTLPQRHLVNLFGGGVSVWDSPSDERTLVSIPGLEREFEWRIMRFANGTLVQIYEMTADGFNEAISQASPGTGILLPFGMLLGDFVLNPGVEYVGMGRDKTVIYGQLTGAAGCSLAQFKILNLNDTTDSVYAFVASDAGSVDITDMEINGINCGSGNAYGIGKKAGSNVFCKDSIIRGQAEGGGFGYSVGDYV